MTSTIIHSSDKIPCRNFIKRLPNGFGRLKSPRFPGALSKIFPEENFSADHKPLGFPIQEGYGRKPSIIY
jgi:hypothetical protein